MSAPLQRASVLALAAVVALTGCASAYNFSPRLDTHVPGAAGKASATRGPEDGLAGDLDLALAGLMDQRRQLWTAAGELDQMKNATVLGLIGLGAAGLYRGLESELNKGWLARAGLLASATYTGAQFLEPDARRQVNLQGATALTCLALATAPYEMTKTEQAKVKDSIANARVGLEQLSSALRSVGQVTKGSETYWVVRNGWNKLRFANGVLRSADAAMGTIEATGPRLRDTAALLASDTAQQVSQVSKRLEDLPAALEKLRPNVALLIGTPLPAVPPPGGNAEPPGVVDEQGKSVSPGADSEGAGGGAGAAASCEAPKSSGTDSAKPDVVKETAAPPSEADKRLAAIEAAVEQINKRLSSAPGRAKAPAQAASKPALTAQEAAQQAAAQRQAAQESALNQAQLSALRDRLQKAMAELDKHLGAVSSFALRVTSAQKRQELPKVCQAAAVVALVPDQRAITLQAGETFQFLLEGDTGRATASQVGETVGREVLDLSMPLGAGAAGTAVRLSAGKPIKQATSTVVRLSDSRGQQSWDISVKLCP